MTSSNQCVTVRTLNKTQTSTKKPCQRITSIASAKQLNGKELSFNNIRDADTAIRIIRDFKERPTVVALKHMNPCGIGQADDVETVGTTLMSLTQFLSFGGIVVLNREVDAATAEKMHGVFLESSSHQAIQMKR